MQKTILVCYPNLEHYPRVFRISEREVYTMNRLIAVVDNGVHAKQVFGTVDGVKLHYSCDLGSSPGNLVDLLRTPVIIIPFHSDQNLLARHQEQLKQYIRNGGVLIVLGANQDSGFPWIPYV